MRCEARPSSVAGHCRACSCERLGGRVVGGKWLPSSLTRGSAVSGGWDTGRLYMCNAAQKSIFAPYGPTVVHVQLANALHRRAAKEAPCIRPDAGASLCRVTARGCGPSIRGFAMLASDRFGSAVLLGSLAAGTLRAGRRLIPFDSAAACGSETGNTRSANRREQARRTPRRARPQEALFIVSTRGAPFRPCRRTKINDGINYSLTLKGLPTPSESGLLDQRIL
jgi:hypothetical protein